MDFKGLQRLSKALRGPKRLSKATKYSKCSVLTTHRTHLYPKPLLKLFASYLFTSFYWAIFMPSHHQKCACKFLTENCQLSNSTQAQEESSIKATTFLALKLSRVDISSTPGATSCKMSPLKNAQCCLETWSCNILEFMVKINIIRQRILLKLLVFPFMKLQHLWEMQGQVPSDKWILSNIS